ncbi:prolipoprotein diacylglyceryl transferase [Marinoscillum sp. MHG1-6]|uniref:prolipoprotein diacylglyceryl transferase n=1 Tax=Marinoscillum sp. MHG1-6 TaxID=2959627 RepID=UPI002156FD7B|nr:prolipoprotein diacylglyceryl transferase [Marinoscillum sp. MHG1-6]
MYPELFTIGDLTVYSYGFMIMLGAATGYFYLSNVGKREFSMAPEKVQLLVILIVVSAFIGGKLFFYLEDPSYYFSSFEVLKKSFRNGFVFYGSLLFAIPVVAWFFIREKLPVWRMMDRIAIVACIIHGFGRMGCFLAGCCYGIPTESFLGVTYHNPKSQAEPLHVALHPTQLYELFSISAILVLLLMLKRYQRLEGRLIFVYVVLYAAVRAIIEEFRGDIARGFLFDGWLSHAQFISIVLIVLAVVAYLVGYRKKRI